MSGTCRLHRGERHRDALATIELGTHLAWGLHLRETRSTATSLPSGIPRGSMSRRPRHAPQLLIRLAPMLGAVGLCLLPMRALAVAPFVLETVDGGAGQAVEIGRAHV